MPPPIDYPEMVLRLFASLAVGCLIGLNRFVRHKAAGLRTHGLVALGAAIATLSAACEPGADAQTISRVVQGLVTGVGFIGAGVILHNNARVQGLTTAASVWAAAILGIACGAGHYGVSLLGLLLSMGILLCGRSIERAAAKLLRWNPSDDDEELSDDKNDRPR